MHQNEITARTSTMQKVNPALLSGAMSGETE